MGSSVYWQQKQLNYFLIIKNAKKFGNIWQQIIFRRQIVINLSISGQKTGHLHFQVEGPVLKKARKQQFYGDSPSL